MPIEDNPSKWTVETVKALLTTIVEQNDRLYRERFDSQAQEFREFRVSTEARFASVNEFRGALSDAQRELMPRSEAEVLFQASAADRAYIKEMIAALKAQIDATQAKGTGVQAGWAWAAAVIGLGLSIVLGLSKLVP